MTKICKVILAVSVSAAILFNCGCVKRKNQYALKEQFLFEVERQRENVQPMIPAALEVQRFGIVSAFEGRGLVYKKEEVVYESDFYNEFFTSPRSLITEQIKDWLCNSGIFKNVVMTDSNISTDLIIEGNIQKLYGDFTEKRPEAVIQIQFFLVHETLNGSKVFIHDIYSEREPFEEKSPRMLVKAYNACLRRILEKLEKQIRVRAEAIKTATTE